MNRIKSWIVLSLMLFLGGQMMGQTEGTLLLGASFPMGEFGNFDRTDFALSTSGNDAGAAIGFNLGIKWYFNVGVPGLNVLLSVDGMYNGLNASAKEYYKDRESFLDAAGSDVQISMPRYINVPVMLGLNYTYYFNPSFGVYVEGGAGGDAHFITRYTEQYSLLSQKLKADVKYETAFSFAWQVGAGFEVAKNLVLGCSYYNLGKANVKADKTGEILTTPVPAEGANTNPSMFLTRIGFKF